MQVYGNALSRLMDTLASLPGIGKKSAGRLALYLIAQPEERVRALTDAIWEAKQKVRYCAVCQNLSEDELCPVCQNPKRDAATVMVVESPRDLAAYERTGEYHGLYHVLQGCISPMNGVGPDDLKIKELLERVQQGGIDEIILATNPTVEGEATALYLARLLKLFPVKVTRIANGVPVGGDLEYVDQATLARALEGRREVL